MMGALKKPLKTLNYTLKWVNNTMLLYLNEAMKLTYSIFGIFTL